MCGIFGAVHSRQAFIFDREAVQRALDTIRHRGPDDEGIYLAPGVVLGNRRLAIQDLSPQGHMPMASHDGRYWITYNGEVYNFQSLRARLEAKGHRFRSGSDTEVLLALYEEHGADMLELLNGMFAFAIWDAQTRTLFAARDRMGIKPFYFSEVAGALYFASEQKALFAAGLPLEWDTSTLEELLCFRGVAGAVTPFRGITRLLPGESLTWRDGTARLRRWWSLRDAILERRASLPPSPEDWFRETLADSVRLRRISDVPVGVFLSGGLDSSSVAALLASQAGAGVSSFTVRFRESGFDEGDVARLTAVRWALDHHELFVPREKLLDEVTKASWLSDEPLAHGNDLYLLAISRVAKPIATVLLSGEGADETLGGYVRYQPLRWPRALRALHAARRAGVVPFARGRLRKLARLADFDSQDEFVLFNSCDVLPQDLAALGLPVKGVFPYRESLLEESRVLYGTELMRRAMYVDQHTYLGSLLDRIDRMTMGASVETRVPFLDNRLVETLGALPTRAIIRGWQSKRLLRQSTSRLIPKAVRRSPKWGFGVPWARYLREDPGMRDVVLGIPTSDPFRHGPFDPKKLRTLLDGFMGGEPNNEMLVRQLFMIAVWYEAYVRRAGARSKELAS